MTNFYPYLSNNIHKWNFFSRNPLDLPRKLSVLIAESELEGIRYVIHLVFKNVSKLQEFLNRNPSLNGLC